jgi:hypothetical protein
MTLPTHEAKKIYNQYLIIKTDLEELHKEQEIIYNYYKLRKIDHKTYLTKYSDIRETILDTYNITKYLEDILNRYFISVGSDIRINTENELLK